MAKEKKVTVEITGAVVAGKSHGERMEVEESYAKHLEGIGYAKIVEAPKPKPKRKAKESEPKAEDAKEPADNVDNSSQDDA